LNASWLNNLSVNLQRLKLIKYFKDYESQTSVNKLCLKITFPELKVILIKPISYMNNSGYNISKCLQNIKTSSNDLFIAYDDLDIELGKFKISNKSPKSHNGILSINQHFGKKYTSIRIGIENRTNNEIGEEFVLKKFSNTELNVINKVTLEIANSLFEKNNQTTISL